MPAKWVFLPCLFFSLGAHAEARIDDLRVALAGDQVLASLSLNGAFDRRLLGGELIESRTVRDREALEEAMTRIHDIPVFSVGGLPHAERLLVRAQAELGSRTILLFIPSTLTTDWEESRQFRPPAGAPR
jgi:hypothetical protein